MYGYKLRTWIYRRLILVVTLFLTFFTLSSWSQNAFQKYHDLLNIALILIATHFLEMGLEYIERQRELYNWSFKVRFEHLCFFGAFSFMGIIIFPLSSPLFPDLLHMVATGLGVLALVLLILGWFKMWSFAWWAFIASLSIGVLLLVSAFMFNPPWSVGHGEFAIMISGLVFFEIIKEK